VRERPAIWSAWAPQALDETRRRVQQEQTGHRGHKADPLYEIRGLLRRGAEKLTDWQQARPRAAL
jgi:transposase